MKIKVKLFNKDCKFEVIDKGDWIDLKSAESLEFKSPYAEKARKNENRIVKFNTGTLRLGIGMKLPEGFEAVVVPRSSTFKEFGIVQRNSVGVIDQSYCGPTDEWRFPYIVFKEGSINKGDRVCQFKIQLSQKATFWQKLKWLFTSNIKFEFVDDYDGVDRGGFGSTGK